MNFLDGMDWNERLKVFDALVDKCPRFDRKGKSMIYTSANGYMFALLNKDGEIGIRFPKAVQEKYIKEFQSSIYKSYGAVMKGYVLIPDHMLEDLDTVAKYLNESYDYVMSLEPK
ncbi:TfoX/Sxy family protein [Cognatitamlana onchidii]|uniref:TfoX/Sxy family protein n=1 Tax=Cognatitamlana onchidii TaxID=2562860 RepID=UPI001F43167F|nr:TfoX/Sxy family protein [Algibacter onchidii]